MDSLPYNLKNSPLLTGNELGRLGSAELLPSETELKNARMNDDVRLILENEIMTSEAKMEKLHNLVRQKLAEGKKREALVLGFLL